MQMLNLLRSRGASSRRETPFREWATRSAAFARSVGGAVLTPFESESDTFRDTVALALCLLNERFGGDLHPRRFRRHAHFSDDLIACGDARAIALEGTSTQARVRRRTCVCARGERGDVVIDARRHSVLESARDLYAARRRELGLSSTSPVVEDPLQLQQPPSDALADHMESSRANDDSYVVRLSNDSSCYGITCNDRALRMYGFCADELIVNDTRDVLVRGLGSFLGVHPSNDAFEESVRQVTESGARDARDAWTAEREAWSRSEDIASAKSVDVDDLWMRRVAVLRRGQAEIIDAYVRAFK